MAGCILIIDSVTTNRIVLKVKLQAAHYRVFTCATLVEARTQIADAPPDLILLDMTADGQEAREFVRTLRANTQTSEIPVIGLGHFDRPEDRLAAFQAGMADILPKPVSDIRLLARIRSLLRVSDANAELRLRDDTSRALGFAEAAPNFEDPGRIVMVSDAVATSLPFANRLSDASGCDIRTIDAETALVPKGVETPPDLIVIDASALSCDADQARIFRLIADLRGRSESRHCSQLVILPEDCPETDAMALDLGANDVVPATVSLAEIALRARALVRQKHRLDQLRDTVQSGLKAAITDPLTGIYNRRYAIPHVGGLLQRARNTGRDFAILALDIDHFKRINDTWGHAVGDKILIGVTQRIKDNLRAGDLVARVGGEEFLVALPEVTFEQAKGAAERLRRTIQAGPFFVYKAATPISVTLSIGVAIGTQTACLAETVDQILERADAALYVAKAAGRNTIEISQSAA
ncbi:MAG: diguanylate cyclase [Rhodobacteraceae bacterium]|nr:diguanylate cyclase [Paracoccaceae bacterium]